MSAVLYLRRDDSGYAHAGEHFTPAAAADLIEPFRFAVVSRFDGSLVAADSPERLAAFGAPRVGADLAQEIWAPDWYHTACGAYGTGEGSCGCSADSELEADT